MIKNDGENTLASALRALGRRKYLVSDLDELDSMKEKTRFEWFSTLSITAFSDAKEIVKMMKGVCLGGNFEGRHMLELQVAIIVSEAVGNASILQSNSSVTSEGKHW